MRYKFLLLIAFLFVSTFAFAQYPDDTGRGRTSTKKSERSISEDTAQNQRKMFYEMRNSVGADLILYTGNGGGILYGLNWTPRFLLTPTDKFYSLALSIPFSIGFTSNNRTNLFYTHVPALAEFSLFHEANSERESRFGLFAGAGFAYNYLNVQGFRSQYGPMVSAGFRYIGIYGQSSTLRFSLTQTMNDNSMFIGQFTVGTNF